MTRYVFLLVLLFSAMPSSTGSCATTAIKRPTPEELIQRWIEMSGGEEQYEKITGRLEDWGMRLGPQAATLQTRSDVQGRFLTIKTGPEEGSTAREGCDGKVGWRIGWDEAPSIMDPNEREILQIIADPAWPLHPERYMRRMVIPGQEWFGEESCWQVVGLLADKKRVELFFSVKTGHWRGMEYILRNGENWKRMQVVYTDYQMREGLLVPHTFSAGDQRISVFGSLREFKLNPDLPESIFSLPPEVEAIVASGDDSPPIQTAPNSGHQALITMIGPSLIQGGVGTVPSSVLGKKDAILLYFSAAWCPPCRAFTPSLVKFAKAHAQEKNFAVILVSSDRNAAAMEKYMADYAMDFFAVPFDRVAASGLTQRFGDRGIPNLVWLNRDDVALAKSYANGTYVGPRKVMSDFSAAIGVD